MNWIFGRTQRSGRTGVAQGVRTPRFVPVDCDIKALGVRSGDLLAVVPLDRFRGDAIYMISVEGMPMAFRCMLERDGQIRLRSLDPRGGVATLTETEFREVLLGQVLAACKVLDASLLAGAPYRTSGN